MSGLRYNKGKLRWSLVDFKSLEPMVRVLEYGAHKYSVFSIKLAYSGGLGGSGRVGGVILNPATQITVLRHPFVDDSRMQVKGSEITPEELAKQEYSIVSSGDNNWKGGLKKQEVLECAMRHLTALMDGEEIDPESGQSHMGHVMCNAMFYNYFERIGWPENSQKQNNEQDKKD